MGKSAFDDAIVEPATWYDENDVRLLTGRTVERLDPAEHELELSGGEVLSYDKAVLATGARPRVLDIPGAELARTLRRVEDSEALRESIASSSSMVVIGGGWIGLEVTAAAREAASTSWCSRPRRCRCNERSVTRSPATSPSCTASMASTCGRPPASTPSAAPGPSRSRPAATSSQPISSSWASEQCPTPSSPRPPVSRSTTASSSTSGSPPATPTCSRSATWPEPATPLSTSRCAWSTGTTRSSRAGRSRRSCSVRTWSTTGSRTSTPTSTTSAWSTSATPTRPTTWWSAATGRPASSSRSGSTGRS